MLKSLRGLLNDHLFDDSLPSDRSSCRLQHPGYTALIIFGSFSLVGGTVSIMRSDRDYTRPIEKKTAYVAPPIQLVNETPYVTRDKR